MTEAIQIRTASGSGKYRIYALGHQPTIRKGIFSSSAKAAPGKALVRCINM
ncbi:MAG: hypothetical protein ACLSAH_07115 [Bilophila wadsworthia]